MIPAEEIVEELFELLQKFIRLRPNLLLPEHVVQFQQEMDSLRGSGASGLEDYTFLFRIFIILAQSEKPPTMGELSASLDVPLSTATRIVDWLVRGNFVARIQDSKDRRVVRVDMTKNGRQYYQTCMAYNKQGIVQLLDNFTSKEQVQLLHLMSKLLDSLMVEQ